MTANIGIALCWSGHDTVGFEASSLMLAGGANKNLLRGWVK